MSPDIGNRQATHYYLQRLRLATACRDIVFSTAWNRR